MRQFSSYGPVDSAVHFAVERRELVERCVLQLVGQVRNKGGHYFTIWGPRQTGKTWIMRRAVEEIQARYGDEFRIGVVTLQGMVDGDEAKRPLRSFLEAVPEVMWEGFDLTVPEPKKFVEWRKIFAKDGGVFDRPVILLLDEFDSLPPKLIDRLVADFRKMYLSRSKYWLHGLALVGVRAVLGVDSSRGSPFNVQRSMQIPNLTKAEVEQMFGDYQAESGQSIEPAVVEALYVSTRGQPGLVGWFGELLTEKYNPGRDKPIGMTDWRGVYGAALYVEWNNTMLNLGKKARGPYRAEVMKLFTSPNVPFALEEEWCSFLYLNGIIDYAFKSDEARDGARVCRFSSPFVQMRLYSGFTRDMFGDTGPLPAITLDDGLDDVFTPGALRVPQLLERYRGYLRRLKDKGIDPWIGQPRRQDLHFTEAVGHFHLYAWLQNAVGRRCTISPEFPTGNGKVDLVLRTKESTALIEVKSIRDKSEVAGFREQAAVYAKKLGLSVATVAVFAPTEDDAMLASLSSESSVDGILVTIVALGWV